MIERCVEETSGITSFAARVSRYFLDFLETDFKKQQAPRRKIQLKNDAGFRTGLPLRKYPDLYMVIWKILSSDIGEISPLRIARSRFTAPISPILRNLIRNHVNSMESDAFIRVRQETIDYARRNRGKAVENPEQYIENVQIAFVESVSKSIVRPVLALLDGPFRQQSYSAVESVYEVETDLAEALAVHVVTQLPSALNDVVVSSEFRTLEKVLDELFSEEETKERAKAFFEDFATADAYQELRDLSNYVRLGGESLQLYLYVCDLRFGTSAYPICYIPASVKLDESNGEIVVEFDPHLFVNKRAIDYIIQEMGSSAVKLALSPIDNRIIYLEPHQAFIDEIHRVLVKMLSVFDLSGEFDVRAPKIQALSSANLRLTKNAYFAVFDKSDESLLNDYEALLAIVNEDQKNVVNLFHDIIKGFLIDEPVSVRGRISDNWDAMPIPDRLVAMSPIPLNEEQRKIIAALDDPDCRFITVQGPPGTGKSHTITAIAFVCILKGRNVLILSDKKEALDVVEDKLKTTLSSIRQDDDFPDPILRLGKTGNTYTRLISHSSQEKIRNHYKASKGLADKLEKDIQAIETYIRHSIAQAIDAFSKITLREIEELHLLEDHLETILPGITQGLQQANGGTSLVHLEASLSALNNADPLVEYFSRRYREGSLSKLIELVKIYSIVAKLKNLRSRKPSLSLFEPLGVHQLPILQRFIREYEDLKMPILGYLFRGSKLKALAVRITQELPCINSLDIHNHLNELKVVHDSMVLIRETLAESGLPEEYSKTVYSLLLKDSEHCEDASNFLEFLENIKRIIEANPGCHNNQLVVGGKYFQTTSELINFILSTSRYALQWHKVKQSLSSAPLFDYVGSKSKLEQLYTARMTHEIDHRFLNFVEMNRATAKTLGKVIKAKQQFPQDVFQGLKEAFPCIIAGIREFAEYVPLRKEIFDVVVIDEASQVSVAQAFPALLRAKKVVVLGDQKQFSNVKSAQASNALNQGYLNDLDKYFRANISTAADKIQRLKQFDIKNSVLEFFDLIANYTEMLRKHFRGYQELISFSSKYFYGGHLQAIKVRGKPIEEVIEFSFVKPSDKPERYKNINTPEAQFIKEMLHQMIDEGIGQTVGIITPFREQQQFLTKYIFGDSYADRFEEELRLKIMTFDTCQGEERDIIIYSMVATPTQDLLNYIFPVSMDNIEDRVEEALKVQRLNVGFSRAKEKIHFVLSKPVESYHGSIGRVLSHYKALLDDRAVPEADETDPDSPMEQKVLDWIIKTPFFQRNEEKIELTAQFPIGEYLRQLDPTYQHPAYRCDFLLQYCGEEKLINIIIEYDGFREHFTEYKKVHSGNYDTYYRPEDIERQMILESYGYKFLRINRFNLGRDPVETLSKRLYALVDSATKEENVDVVKKIIDDATSLHNGTSKVCRKCNKVKLKEAFYDPNLKNGKGGYGFICKECKYQGKRSGTYNRKRKSRRYTIRRW